LGEIAFGINLQIDVPTRKTALEIEGNDARRKQRDIIGILIQIIIVWRQ
jgi:hypothetical protein